MAVTDGPPLPQVVPPVFFNPLQVMLTVMGSRLLNKHNYIELEDDMN